MDKEYQKIYRSRRQRLLDMVDGVALIFANVETVRNNDVLHSFRQDSDFFYLTGFDEPDAALLLDKKAAPGQRTTLFLRPRNPEREIWDGHRLGVERAVEALGIDAAQPIETLSEVLKTLLPERSCMNYQMGQPFRVEQDKIVLDALSIANRRRKNFESIHRIEGLSPTLHEMRLIKDSVEIETMRKAASLTALGHKRAMEAVRPDVREYQLQHAMEYEWLSRGAQRNAYPSIVGSGPNACILHYHPGARACQAGELVLIDAGCEMDGYACDVTRTFPVSGRFSPSQKEIYELVLNAQRHAIELCQPGHTYAEIHQATIKWLVEGLVDLGLLEGDVDELIEEKAFLRFYMHGTGHWLGMDVHDVGAYRIDDKDRPLKHGMVLTIEPGLYISPDDESVEEKYRGIGIRIEDDILVTDTGPVVLTDEIPKNIEDVEGITGRSPLPDTEIFRQ